MSQAKMFNFPNQKIPGMVQIEVSADFPSSDYNPQFLLQLRVGHSTPEPPAVPYMSSFIKHAGICIPGCTQMHHLASPSSYEPAMCVLQ